MIRLARLVALWTALALAVGVPFVVAVTAARAAAPGPTPWVFQAALQEVGGETVALMERADGFATREACEAHRTVFDRQLALLGNRLTTPDGRAWRVLATRCWIDAITA